MADTCLVCLRPLPGGHEGETHSRCAKAVFGTKRVPALEVDPHNLHLLGIEMAGRVTVSGVQKKIALGLERGTLRVMSSGHGEAFLLKPQTEEYPDLPQNEQLCVRLAKAVGLRTPPTALVRLSDGSLAFLSRRFDRVRGHRLPVEDFCQLAEKLPRDKYGGSYEQCAKLLRDHSDEWLADGAELFRLVLFSWWVGNGDLHLKNLALLGEDGRHRLSPCYDLVSTSIVGLDDSMALTIGGRHSRIRPADWFQLGERLGLTPRAMAREVVRVVKGLNEALSLASRVPMREDLVVRFLELLRDRSDPLLELGEAVVAEIEKPTKPITAPLVPTGRSAVEAVREIERALEDVGLPEDSVLAGELRELGWLARADGSIFSDDGPWAEDRERSAHAFHRLNRLKWAARVLAGSLAIPGSEGARKHLRWLATEPEGSVPGQAGDYLFELEVAAALQATGWLTIRMTETDVEILDPDGTVFGIECKRPRSADSIVANFKRAIDQLEHRGRAGFVVLSLGATGLLPSWIVADGRGAALEGVRRLLGSCVKPCLAELDRRFSASPDLETLAPGTVIGAVFTSDVVIATRAEHLGGYVVRPHTVARTVSNPHHSGLAPINELLAHAIMAGADALQR